MGLTMRRATPEQRSFITGRVGQASDAAAQARLSRPLRARVRAAAARRSTLARHWLEDAVVGLVGGPESRRELRLGRFRRSGEIHLWMYDRYSLGRLFHKAGFEAVKERGADESSIPAFETFCLEVVDGRVRKPDSLFVEALRP